MVDADQVQAAFARRPVGGQQVFRPQFVVLALLARERVFERQRFAHVLDAATGKPEHGATAFARIGPARVRHHDLPRFPRNPNHASSQKGSLKYFSALSHNTVTMVALSPRALTSRATVSAAQAAREKGYTGDPCPECGHLTLVRNGACMKCQTCGATTGCS